MPATLAPLTFPVSRTWTASLPDRYAMTATAKLYQLAGNQRPHFSLTGELLNMRRRGDNRIEAGGAMHDAIVAQWPELAPLAAIHLSDDRGIPMHAVENGAYFLGFTTPCSELAPDFRRFAKLWRVSTDAAERIHAEIGTDPHPREALQYVAKLHAAQWAREAREAWELIADGAADE